MIALIALGQVLAAPIEPPPFVTPEMIERGITSMGDGWRLQAVVEKARSGGEVTIGVIGGSITEGASATSEDRRYGNQIAAWWQTALMIRRAAPAACRRAQAWAISCTSS